MVSFREIGGVDMFGYCEFQEMYEKKNSLQELMSFLHQGLQMFQIARPELKIQLLQCKTYKGEREFVERGKLQEHIYFFAMTLTFTSTSQNFCKMFLET